MNEKAKIYSDQFNKIKDQFESENPQNLLVAKGHFPGLGEDFRIELVVYDHSVKNKQQNLATIKLTDKGQDILYLQGVVWGLLNPKTPILFRTATSPAHGAVDVVKMYHLNGEIQGKLFPEDLSIAYKLASSKKRGSVAQKRRINELRDDHAIGFTLTVDPKHTHVVVPDNIKPTKTADHSDSPKLGA